VETEEVVVFVDFLVILSAAKSLDLEDTSVELCL
jgi:hypothetical protein